MPGIHCIAVEGGPYVAEHFLVGRLCGVGGDCSGLDGVIELDGVADGISLVVIDDDTLPIVVCSISAGSRDIVAVDVEMPIDAFLLRVYRASAVSISWQASHRARRLSTGGTAYRALALM